MTPVKCGVAWFPPLARWQPLCRGAEKQLEQKDHVAQRAQLRAEVQQLWRLPRQQPRVVLFPSAELIKPHLRADATHQVELSLAEGARLVPPKQSLRLGSANRLDGGEVVEEHGASHGQRRLSELERGRLLGQTAGVKTEWRRRLARTARVVAREETRPVDRLKTKCGVSCML